MHVFTVLFVNIRLKQYNVGFLSCEKNITIVEQSQNVYV